MDDNNIERWQGYYDETGSMVTGINYNHNTNQWGLWSSIFVFDKFTASGARTDYPWDLEWYLDGNPQNKLIVLPPQD